MVKHQIWEYTISGYKGHIWGYIETMLHLGVGSEDGIQVMVLSGNDYLSVDLVFRQNQKNVRELFMVMENLDFKAIPSFLYVIGFARTWADGQGWLIHPCASS